MNGTIGIPTGEFARFSSFGQSLLGLDTPPHTKVVWTTGGNIAKNCNRIVQEMEGDWLWLIGDDHVFKPDVLKRLLAREVDLVVPLCSQRVPPYSYGVYRFREDGAGVLIDLSGQTGLVPVDLAGSAGLLVRKPVLDKMEKPYFRLGQYHAETEGEDIDFFIRAGRAGFQLYVDTDTVIGHTAMACAWPQRMPDGAYGTRLEMGADINFTVRFK